MKDNYTKDWIIENAVGICNRYDDGVLTLRSLHYQLVGIGMINDIQHYKRVVTAMIDARWDKIISFEKFSDLDRVMVGETNAEATNVLDKVEQAKNQVELWMRNYSKNKWENQPYYPEVFIEKKALQGVFSEPTRNWKVSLGACKGYPSLTFLHEAYLRFQQAIDADKQPIIIYFGDYDPSGEDIPRSIQDNLLRFGVEVEVRRIALMEDQVVKWKLPPAPTKLTDTRTAKWEGLGQVELDAVQPETLQQMCNDAIEDLFDTDLEKKLQIQQDRETIYYRDELQKFVTGLK